MIDMDNSIQPKKEKISGLVITFNEEKNIAGCIESLKCICDDIVVVDSFSQDRTVDIARSMGATVILQKFLGDGPQRTKGVDYCLHDWIFNLDADERLEDDAIQAIKELSLDSSEVDVYELKRHNYIGDQITLHAGQYPDRVARLFNRKTAAFSPKQTHTKVHGKRSKNLEGHIKHFSYRDYFDLFSRQCKYANQIGSAISPNEEISSFSPFIHGSWSFFRHYFLKKGFLAGNLGLTISIAKAMGAYLKYSIALEKSRR